LSIFAICTDPRFVEPSNSQPSAIGKCESLSSVINQEAYMFFNSDRPSASGFVGDDNFSSYAIVLSARLPWLYQDGKRDNKYRALTGSPYPISNT
jgi:hypothetical protein